MSGRCPDGRAHHFRIASPSGRTSPGICQNCGTSEEFFNSHWEDRGETSWMDKNRRDRRLNRPARA